MDWDSLEPGSLNLCVDGNAVASLAELEALICERPDEIDYPEEYEHIPKEIPLPERSGRGFSLPRKPPSSPFSSPSGPSDGSGVWGSQVMGTIRNS